IAEALHLVSRICGSCSIAHSLAFCLALEGLAGLEPGARASSLRCAAAEFERAAAHLDAAGKTLRAVGMPAQARMVDAIVGQLRHALTLLTGAPLAPSYVLPGGVARNLANAEYEELALFLPKLNRSLLRTAEHLIDNRALLARTVEVGALPRAAAEQFGLRGPAARASGIARDVRVDKPYSSYGDLAIKPIVQEGGDVFSRLVVLLLEAYESLKLAEQFVRELPDGKWQGRVLTQVPRGEANVLVEAPRGPLRYALRGDGMRITDVTLEPPRQLDRLLARTLLAGALLDNVVAIIASADHCTSCAEA
ncbi:MAG TPA: NADH-quinone oxidoreductase subunit D, partial [Roseiflexaceae bacterium]|nr:NADH-quinone oxidoreductase subunit D [Roseiflexaceae bacterium]